MDPFVTLDQEGVGALVEMAVERGRDDAPRAQGRDLRRARGRPGQRRVLPPHRARLRLVLAVPGADRAAGGGAGGAARQGGRQRPAIAACRVAILIPALNEAESIERVLAEIPQGGHAGGAGVAFIVDPIVVVDNGSTDQTAARARGAGAVVIEEPHRGYGAACLAGLARLRRVPPDVVVFLDADQSDDPAQLPELLAPMIDRGIELVIGSRTLGEREAGSLTGLQSFGNRLATWLMRVLFGTRFTDLGPFRAVRWQALERLRMRDRDYGWTVEMQARALRAGLRTAEVAVRHRRRRLGDSKVSGTLRGALGAGWKILFTIARVRLGG